MNDFFGLGRYAPYIVPAYVVTALGFGWMVVDTLLRARRWRREALRREASQDAGEREDPT